MACVLCETSARETHDLRALVGGAGPSVAAAKDLGVQVPMLVFAEAKLSGVAVPADVDAMLPEINATIFGSVIWVTASVDEEQVDRVVVLLGRVDKVAEVVLVASSVPGRDQGDALMSGRQSGRRREHVERSVVRTAEVVGCSKDGLEVE